jgi:hypothetical protein
MQLRIDGETVTFTDMRDYRQAHNLPADFGIAMFEPKSYEGLGRIDGAGAEMNDLRESLLKGIPERLTVPDLLDLVPKLTNLFRMDLYAINDSVGLRDVEVEYAVSGFGDVCQSLTYALARSTADKSAPPAFSQIYTDWLNDTVQVAVREFDYAHGDDTWTVRIVSHAYGRVGLLIDTPDGRQWVAERSLACPAEGFMYGLLGEIAGKIIAAVSG